MKIYINKPKEDWVVDRFVSEWKIHNSLINTNSLNNADIIWLIAPWTWRKISKRQLSRKTVVATVHHIDEEKFDKTQQKEFLLRDSYIDYYHTISTQSSEQLKKYTDKPIFKIPFWVNQEVWFNIENKNYVRQKYGLNNNSFLIGSFQRDTEGSDLISPKLSKGPDQFFQIVKELYSNNKNISVILCGTRRNYLIDKLKKEKIPYKYFEMADFKTLNELYNCLDLYIVSSRVEGGPQAILECAITKTPIISTDVGIASEILGNDSIFDMTTYKVAKPDIEFAYNNANRFKLPEGMGSFTTKFRSIYES